jgi:triosephosphate isomerase (TIM)
MKIKLSPPVFEVGLKNYLFGKDALELALAADRISKKYNVPIVFDPVYTDIPAIAQATEQLLVFAQHMDSVQIGRGAGAVLPEALKAAGADGTLLNHAERPIALGELARAIRRAKEVGLLTLVCADSPEQAAAMAHLGPTMILAEPPDLIGTGRSVGDAYRDFIPLAVAGVKRINPDIIVFGSAGIKTPEDVANVIRAGAEATGSTSGILRASDPIRQLDDMVRAMTETWRDMHER